MKIWKNVEVKDLFEAVEDCKKRGEPLKLAFVSHAKKYSRKPNSVRNYYYKEVENLKIDKKRCDFLGISIENHEKTHFAHFSESQEKKLLEDIDKLVADGDSVRTACQKLSGGDLTEMTRLQNKYQNMKKKDKKNNIIVFKQRQKLLTESDINSLFMGLVKLIKKTAIDEFMEKTKLEKQSSAYLLKKAFVDLGRKDKQITALRQEFEDLKKENENLKTRLESLSLDKTKMLKSHLEKRKYEKSTENLK